MAMYLNASNSQENLNRMVDLANDASGNAQKNLINPEVFYSKQLLDTIRIDADQYVYFRLADEAPIQDKADKLTMRRWAPLQAHTTPLDEGVPPVSDKGSVEKYELTAHQYGRYMEFTDKVDFNVVDPVVAHYTKEYSLVAMETLDLLARETLFSIAQKHYAGGAANFEGLSATSKPTLTDLRVIILGLKKALVKPRSNGRFHVIASPEFYFDMISDPIVEKYMTVNQTTKSMYDNTKLVPLFDMEFYETMCVPTHGEFVKSGKKSKRLVSATTANGETTYTYVTIDETTKIGGAGANKDQTILKTVTGYVKDSRTGKNASYLPNQQVWDIAAYNAANNTTYTEFKAQHVLIVGKDALTRTGLAGEGNAKVYVKQKGSTGVLDPIDQRQSIGFKINSVGFGSTRLEAVVDYICVPTQVNAV